MDKTPASSPSRRSFIKHGALAAGAAAAGFGASSAFGQSPGDPAPAASPGSGGWLNARAFGAAGDGRADDTAAIRRAVAAARESGAAGVFLPGGTYMLSGALRLPSRFRLVGAGRGATVLKAVPETGFPLVRPDPRTADIRQRRALVTTEGAGSVRETLTEDVAVEAMTIDWSHCPTGGYGHSVVLMDSVNRGILRDIAFINCMPSDHPPTREEMRGAGFRSECVMYSNARYGLMERCRLTDSGYRPLSVSYGSLSIVFRDGVIHAENPVWRHAFSENHGDGIARDETFILSQLAFYNSTFILDGGQAGDGICSHTGTTHVENCDFYIRGGVNHFSWVIRCFDGSRNCTYVNNRFHCDARLSRRFSMMGTSPRTSSTRDDNRQVVFTGNLVHLSLAPEAGSGRAVVSFSPGDKGVRVEGNHFLLEYADGSGAAVASFDEVEGFSVVNNLMEIHGGETGPDLLRLRGSRAGVLSGNVATGEYRRAVDRDEESVEIVSSDNIWRETA